MCGGKILLGVQSPIMSIVLRDSNLARTPKHTSKTERKSKQKLFPYDNQDCFHKYL